MSQQQGEAQKDPVQVHNTYGYYDHLEDESGRNLPHDDSLSPMNKFSNIFQKLHSKLF